MKTLTANEAEFGLSRLIDLVRAEPATSRVALGPAVEELERQKAYSVIDSCDTGVR